MGADVLLLFEAALHPRHAGAFEKSNPLILQVFCSALSFLFGQPIADALASIAPTKKNVL